MSVPKGILTLQEWVKPSEIWAGVFCLETFQIVPISTYRLREEVVTQHFLDLNRGSFMHKVSACFWNLYLCFQFRVQALVLHFAVAICLLLKVKRRNACLLVFTKLYLFHSIQPASRTLPVTAQFVPWHLSQPVPGMRTEMCSPNNFM